jgi:hypothetical protein
MLAPRYRFEMQRFSAFLDTSKTEIMFSIEKVKFEP